MTQWILYALLAAVFAALTAIFSKVGLNGINSDLATAIRTVFILLITWGVVLFQNKISGLSALTKTNWIFLILSAIATGLSWLFYYRALQAGNVAIVSALDKTSILFVLFLSMIFLNEPLTPKVIIGAGLIFAGTLVMVLAK